MKNPREADKPLHAFAHGYWSSLLTAWAATALLLLAAEHTFAEQAGKTDPPPLDFNIPAQFVPAALGEFARQARVQLFFISDGFENIQANAVVGTYAAQDALDLLLAGTGLAASITPESGVKVRAEPAAMKALTLGSQMFAGVAGQSTNKTAVEAGSSERDRSANDGATESSKSTPLIEEILVTGSRIRGANSPSPMITITRQDISKAGFSTVEDLVDTLPQNFGAGEGQDTRSTALSGIVGGNVEALSTGTSVNLRGLGASSTLILLNGRRMSPSGRSARFTDVSGIPLIAIERVEVLTDGASAVYGSDAIGGVVNFVLRDDYEGAETSMSYGFDSRGDTSERMFGQSFGKSWKSGNALLSYEYYHHDRLANVDRAFAATSDLRPLGGSDRRLDGGNPANIFSLGDFQVYAIPSNQDGRTLTPADFSIQAPLNKHNQRANGDLLPELERHGVFLHLAQRFAAIEAFSDIRYSNHKDDFRADSAVLDFFVPETNPFFVDPTGFGGGVFVLGYSFAEDLGPLIVSSESESFDTVAGLKFEIGTAWTAELAANWSHEQTTSRRDNRINQEALTVALNETDPDVAFNPFGDGSFTSTAVLDGLRFGKPDFDVENELKGVTLNFNGEMYEIPGGPIQIAAGAEYRSESLISKAGQNVDILAPESNNERDVLAVYTEFLFPLLGRMNAQSRYPKLELSVALRYEDYSDFGGSTTPKTGLIWSLTEALTLRGTYGRSFRAPALFDLDESNAGNSFIYLPTVLDPGIPFPTLVLQGANENLSAEEADTWTAGFHWHPTGVGGLSLEVTYFDIDFEDRIDAPFVNILDGFSDSRFATLLNTMPTFEEIAAVANDPRYLESVFGITTPAADLLSGAAPVGAILDRRKQNLSRSVVTGTELGLAYTLDTLIGQLDLGLMGSYLFNYERSFLEVDPLVDEVDTFGRPVDFRARGSVTWVRDRWSASGYLNYTDGYTDNSSSSSRSVQSWTTVDLTIAFEPSASEGVLQGTRVALSVHNLLDEDPPFVNTIDGLGYDTSNANALGRLIGLKVRKEW